MDMYTSEVLSRCGVDSSAARARNLLKTNLSQKYLVGVDLRGFTITKTNFECANLTGANLSGLQFAEANCIGACFIGANLRGANLAFGYFNNADFSGADMRGARVADALCNECTFAGADMRGAIFTSTHYDSDFRGADLRGIICSEEADFANLNCDIRTALITPAKTLLTAANKRRHKRVQILAGLRVHEMHSNSLFGKLLDMSREGLRISTESPNPIGAVYQFKIALPDGSNLGDSLCMTVRSVWCKMIGDTKWYHTGFQITEIANKDLQIIEAMVKDSGGKGVEIL